jgi:hypothetical protein
VKNNGGFSVFFIKVTSFWVMTPCPLMLATEKIDYPEDGGTRLFPDACN